MPGSWCLLLTLQFYPIWFAKGSPLLTYIPELNQRINFFCKNFCFWKFWKFLSPFSFCWWANQIGLLQKKKRQKRGRHPLSNKSNNSYLRHSNTYLWRTSPVTVNLLRCLESHCWMAMSCSSASLVLSCFISPLSLSEFSKIILVLQAITVWGRQCMSFWASCCSHLGNKYTKDWALWLCYKFWSKSWNGTEFLLVPSFIPHSLNATTQCIQKMVPTCNMWMLSMHVLLFANWHIYCAQGMVLLWNHQRYEIIITCHGLLMARKVYGSLMNGGPHLLHQTVRVSWKAVALSLLFDLHREQADKD